MRRNLSGRRQQSEGTGSRVGSSSPGPGAGREGPPQAGFKLVHLHHLLCDTASRIQKPGVETAQCLALEPQRVGNGPCEPVIATAYLTQQIGTRGRDHLGGSGRGRRPDVGNEIGDREVRLVANRRDNRVRTGDDGPCHALQIETPQVFQRPTTAGQQHHVGFESASPIEGSNQLALGAVSLYCTRDQCDLEPWKSTLDHVQHITERSAGGTGNDGQVAGVLRQRTLPILIEQPLSGELLLQRFERRAESAFSGRLETIHDQLKIASRLVEADPARQTYLQAVLNVQADQAVAAGEHGAADLRTLVLQGEVPVSGPGTPEVRQLAFHAHLTEVLLDQQPCLAGQLAHAQYARAGFETRRGSRHAAQCTRVAGRSGRRRRFTRLLRLQFARNRGTSVECRFCGVPNVAYRR